MSGWWSGVQDLPGAETSAGKVLHVAVVRVEWVRRVAGVRAELPARTITLVPPPGRYWPRLSP